MCANSPMKTRTIFLALVSALAFADQGEADRVRFPVGYTEKLTQQGEALFKERSGVTTVYVNDLALNAVKSGAAQFPDGAIVVMEFAKPVKDAAGQPVRDAGGVLLKGEIEHVDVMTRGQADADDPSRAGHWSFASFGADGKVLVSPAQGAKCADCHRNAGAEKDFVFRTRPWLAAK
jgi:hypothetical protein